MGTGQALTTRIDARNDQLAALEQDGTKAIVLDLRDLGFIDSSGLDEIVRAYKRSETNGHRLLVVGANPLTRRLCEMTGTEFILD